MGSASLTRSVRERKTPAGWAGLQHCLCWERRRKREHHSSSHAPMTIPDFPIPDWNSKRTSCQRLSWLAWGSAHEMSIWSQPAHGTSGKRKSRAGWNRQIWFKWEAGWRSSICWVLQDTILLQWELQRMILSLTLYKPCLSLLYESIFYLIWIMFLLCNISTLAFTQILLSNYRICLKKIQ